MRVLIIPDKFKGTLTAHEAAQAIAKGWRRARRSDRLTLLPMSDGGDGFGEILTDLLRARPQTIRTVDAAHRQCVAQWSWAPRSKTAIIESAKVIGLAMLPKGEFHPFALDTFGLGNVLNDAAAKGAKACLIGIGGSATNDGGFGMARAMGWLFLRRNGQPIERWTELSELAEILRPKDWHPFTRVTVAVDVQNPLLGAHGCSRIYGPQKGLRPADFPAAERALRRLAKVTAQTLGHDFAKTPGAGAAGGLGFGLMAFLCARPQSGYDLFARHADLVRRLRSADLVITGEGSIDKSTLMGKGVGEIARACQRAKVPCLGLSGVLADAELLRQRFQDVRSLTQITSTQNALAAPAKWLEKLAAHAAKNSLP
ncbi:MAG: glycerate kinase [Verrucomicrobiota bacterium]